MFFCNALSLSMIRQRLSIWSLSASSFSKSILDIWKFLVCIILKPSMQVFKHDLTMWEMSAIAWWLAHTLVLPFLGIGIMIDFFHSCGHCCIFQICWHVECNTTMTTSSRVLISSTGIVSHPLTLITAVVPKALLISHSKMSGSEWPSTPS